MQSKKQTRTATCFALGELMPAAGKKMTPRQVCDGPPFPGLDRLGDGSTDKAPGKLALALIATVLLATSVWRFSKALD